MRHNGLGRLFALLLTIGAISVIGATPVNAAGSVGASFNCDIGGAHCVEGTGQSENVGTSTTGGKAVAVCQGGSNGAIILEVSCSHAGHTSTMSYPGPSGAAYVVVDTESIRRMPVCWTVTGFFYNPFGPLEEVSTSGCAQIAL
jgi:hypothetical protein